jgi:two-component system response regulator DevR
MDDSDREAGVDTTGEIRVFLLDDHEVVRRGITSLVDAVRQVAAGKSLLDPSVTGRLLSRLRDGAPKDARLASLTAREREILGLIADDLTNRQIGERLFLAEKMVKNYVSGLLAKLGMQRRTQAAVFGAETRRT